MTDWFSAAEYRRFINYAVEAAGYPPLTDAEFFEQTAALLTVGMLSRETRQGVKGFSVRNEGVAVVPMRGH